MPAADKSRVKKAEVDAGQEIAISCAVVVCVLCAALLSAKYISSMTYFATALGCLHVFFELRQTIWWRSLLAIAIIVFHIIVVLLFVSSDNNVSPFLVCGTVALAAVMVISSILPVRRKRLLRTVSILTASGGGLVALWALLFHLYGFDPYLLNLGALLLAIVCFLLDSSRQ